MELTATVRRLAQYATRRQRCAHPNTDWTLSRDLNDSTVSLSSMLWATRSLPAPREITSETCASCSVVSSFGVPLPAGIAGYLSGAAPTCTGDGNALPARLFRSPRVGAQPTMMVTPHHI